MKAQPFNEQAMLAEISERLARIETQLNAQSSTPERPLHISAFARRVGLSRSSIYERIRRGQIMRKGGLIPPSELRRFGL